MVVGNDRTLLATMLSPTTYVRIIVRGPVGVTELDRLIQKLTIDKEILAEAPVKHPCKGD